MGRAAPGRSRERWAQTEPRRQRDPRYGLRSRTVTPQVCQQSSAHLCLLLITARPLCLHGHHPCRVSIQPPLSLTWPFTLSFSFCQISPFSSPAGQGCPAAAQAHSSLPTFCSTCSCLAAREPGVEPPAAEGHISAAVPPVSTSILTFVFPCLNAAELQDDCRDGSATITVLMDSTAGSNVSVLHLN